jgi:prolipoprotein diacylglyceryl transferase
MIASIPSPSFDSIDLGPLQINIYGLAIALGVIAAIWLFGRRLEQRGAGTRDDASAIGLWAVLAGVVGARLYHVITDWHRFEDDLGAIPAIWEGGLGIPGGLILGIPAGIWAARRRGISAAMAATCAAPAIPLAQAIGRWGNYFNQELFGTPTTLPWAVEIDPRFRPDAYAEFATFHPTFLYESLWNLALAGVLLLVERRGSLRRGTLFALYLAGYGTMRFLLELIRTDTTFRLLGLSRNGWVSLLVVIGATVVAVRRERVTPSEPERVTPA